MNKVVLIGNLTKDPDLTTTSNGISVCKLNMAVQRKFQNKDGEYDVDFFNVIVWRGQAENCTKWLNKGSKVSVIGSIQNRSYENKDGVKQYITEIVAEEVEFLTNKKMGEKNSKAEPSGEDGE